MNEWQPIETAPKDGTEVLLWDSIDGVCTGRFTSVKYSRDTWWATNSGGKISIAGQTDFGTDYEEVCPSHWMPLPKPPEVK